VRSNQSSPHVLRRSKSKSKSKSTKHQTNYLKRGAYIGGVILVILAVGGIIAYSAHEKRRRV
jgi:hypothetical protein